MKTFSRLSSVGILQIALIMWSILVILPFVLILLLSFRSNADIFLNGFGFGGSFEPSNYVEAWFGTAGTSGMARYFRNSVIVAASALLVNLGAGVTAAYFSIHLSPRGRVRFLMIFIVATVLPLVLMLTPFYQLFDQLGLLNNLIAVGVAYGALALPTTVLVMHAFFMDFPRELLEAASVDGVGPLRTYAQIVLPLSFGPITAVGMLTLIFVWGETQLGVVLMQIPAAQTVPVGLLSFQGQWSSNLGALFAGLSLASIPIMIVYLIFHRQVAKGITLGGFGGR